MLDNLNKQQTEAVEYIEGPLLVLAGAGSGKTMVITYRIANLIKKRIAHPNEILAVTFTNKAAQEMKNRVNNLVGANVWISTFHALCASILRRHVEALGYTNSFTIYDQTDQISVLKSVIVKLNLNKDQFKGKDIANRISRLKEDLVDEKTYEKFANDFYEKNISKIYTEYQKVLKANNALDFSDLIYLAIKVFKNDQSILESYQDRYKYILVDEYQDTNYAQYKFIKLLADKHKNICVVGDPDQSIYSWRGADIQNILNFEKDYKNAKSIKLEQNYRSTQIILDSANKIIEKNIKRKPKSLIATKSGGEKIVCYSAVDHKDEADFICQRILEASKDNMKFSEIAILYRMHALSRVLEENLIFNKIPYEIIGGIKFYDRKEIRDILAYLSFLQNPQDTVAFARIINIPKRGIGKASVEKIITYSLENNISIFEAVKNYNNIDSLSTSVKKKVEKFSMLIEDIMKKSKEISISLLVRDLIDKIDYYEYLKDYDLATSMDRIDNVKELVSSIAEYEEKAENPALEDYLNNVALISDIDSYEQNAEKVTLMTLHNAKGLEYELCFIIALEEGLFPHASSSDDLDELEEERRLCYVGVTRAKQQLYLTSADKRLIYGRWAAHAVSRFVSEIPEQNIKRIRNTGYNFGYGNSSPNSFESKNYGDNSKYKVKEKKAVYEYFPELSDGATVFHDKWGTGRILSRTGASEVDARVKVFFESLCEKKELMLKFANLSRIS
jgi:DNA helicase II / ATP-dependent DNA helicase PcrA